jgi:hypothetical protein
LYSNTVVISITILTRFWIHEVLNRNRVLLFGVILHDESEFTGNSCVDKDYHFTFGWFLCEMCKQLLWRTT